MQGEDYKVQTKTPPCFYKRTSGASQSLRELILIPKCPSIILKDRPNLFKTHFIIQRLIAIDSATQTSLNISHPTPPNTITFLSHIVLIEIHCQYNEIASTPNHSIPKTRLVSIVFFSGNVMTTSIQTTPLQG